MHPEHRLAQLVVAIWKLGSSEDRIPTSHGILDRALKTLHDSNTLPTWAQEELHFTDSRVGLQCIELPSLLEWAQRAHLTTAPNPSYESTQIQISEWLAEDLLSGLELDKDQAIELGKHLSAAVETAKDELEKFEYSQIEEY